MRSMLDNPDDFYLHEPAEISDLLPKLIVIGNIHENPELVESCTRIAHLRGSYWILEAV